MNLYKEIDEINTTDDNYGLIIGNFDGLHLGHVEHLERFKKNCLELKVKPLLLTLRPHPLIYFQGPKANILINSRIRKIELLAKHGIDSIIELPFDKELQTHTAQRFIENYILKINNLKFIHLGHDFKLGSGKENATQVLEDLLKNKEIKIFKTAPFRINNKTCSSSQIRECLQQGDIAFANKMLGYLYLVRGRVIKGKGIGKAQVVATANLEIQENLLIPKKGVYFTQTTLRGKEYKSITNIGSRPTLGFNNDISVETHLIDFNDDIYDEVIGVEFITRLRDEIKFDSLESLKEQIKKDIRLREVYED